MLNAETTNNMTALIVDLKVMVSYHVATIKKLAKQYNFTEDFVTAVYQDLKHGGAIDNDLNNWIKATLTNDEYSSDEEMMQYFITEGPMSKKEAELWVAKRSYYSMNIVMDDGSIYKPSL